MDATRVPLPSTSFTTRDDYRPASKLSSRLLAISSTSLASPRNPNASAKVILARVAGPPSFADEGHAAYYQLHPSRTCFRSGLQEKQKQMKKKKDGGTKVEAKQLKKKIRRLQELLRETIAFADEPNSFANDQVLTETAKNMLERLQQVMALEETAKARRKGERSVAGESSSSSSESSDSEGQGRMNAFDMSRRLHPRTSRDSGSCRRLGSVGMDGAMDSLLQAGNDDDESRDLNSKGLEIEVCMGSKCQKSGAGLVKEELERQVVMGGGGGTVAGCKCMGRCKEGPNVRLSTPNSQISSVCAAVSLDDISSLLSSFRASKHPQPTTSLIINAN